MIELLKEKRHVGRFHLSTCRDHEGGIEWSKPDQTIPKYKRCAVLDPICYNSFRMAYRQGLGSQDMVSCLCSCEAAQLRYLSHFVELHRTPLVLLEEQREMRRIQKIVYRLSTATLWLRSKCTMLSNRLLSLSRRNSGLHRHRRRNSIGLWGCHLATIDALISAADHG